MKRRFSSTSEEDIRILRLKRAGNLRTKKELKSKNIYFNNIILFIFDIGDLKTYAYTDILKSLTKTKNEEEDDGFRKIIKVIRNCRTIHLNRKISSSAFKEFIIIVTKIFKMWIFLRCLMLRILTNKPRKKRRNNN